MHETIKPLPTLNDSDIIVEQKNLESDSTNSTIATDDKGVEVDPET